MASEYQVLAFDKWKIEFEKNKQIKKSQKSKQPYDPTPETPPDVPWSKIDKKDIDKKIFEFTQRVTQGIQNARMEDVELHQLLKAAESVAQIETLKSKAVALVGQQAMGKSLLVNALMHRKDLSKTSASGGACTASAINYCFKEGASNQEDIYDAQVQFMEDRYLKEVIVEHARNYWHCHYSGRSEFIDEDDKRAAQTAEDYFHLVFDTQRNETERHVLGELLGDSSEVRNGSLCEKALKKARRRIKEITADENRIVKWEKLAVKKLMATVESYISQQNKVASLWPLVQQVNIFTGAAVLRSGVRIVDLPGLGDLNLSRTAATYKIRRDAGFEIIVARSDRVTTEEVVDKQIKDSIKAHHARNTILVLTKIDEFFLDTHSIDKEIDGNDDAPFPMIKRYQQETEAEIDRLQNPNDEADAEYVDGEEADTKLPSLEKYQAYLLETAQHAYIFQRAQRIEDQMKNRFLEYDSDPIRVFSVSASMYLEYTKKNRAKQPLLDVEQTGIPQLRRFLLGFTADDHWQNYRNHVYRRLPELVDKVERIVESDKKHDAFSKIRPRLQEIAENLQHQHEKALADFLNVGILGVWQSRLHKKCLESLKNIARKWGEDAKYNTYNKTLRHGGVLAGNKTQAKLFKGIGINWNEDLSQIFRNEMGLWQRKMNAHARTLAKNCEEITTTICHEVENFIKSCDLELPLRLIAMDEWEKRAKKITEHSKTLASELKDQIRETFLYGTTETDTRCMLAKINAEVYDHIQQMPYEEGWYIKQRSRLVNDLVRDTDPGNTLTDNIEQAIRNHAIDEVTSGFTIYLDDLLIEFKKFDGDIGERCPPNYKMQAVDLEIRARLKSLLPELEDRVSELQQVFLEDRASRLRNEKEEVALEVEVEEQEADFVLGSNQDEEPIAKRSHDEVEDGLFVKEHDSDEPATKKVKTGKEATSSGQEI